MGNRGRARYGHHRANPDQPPAGGGASGGSSNGAPPAKTPKLPALPTGLNKLLQPILNLLPGARSSAATSAVNDLLDYLLK